MYYLSLFKKVIISYLDDVRKRIIQEVKNGRVSQ